MLSKFKKDIINTRLDNAINYLRALKDDVSKSVAIFVSYDAACKIPSKDYLEIAKGIFDRRLYSINDLRQDEEYIRDYVEEHIDFEKNIVLLVKTNKGGDFIFHYHDVDEKIHCISGSFIGGGNVIYKPGQVQYIKAFEVHIFKVIEQGICIIELKKPDEE